MSFNMFRCLIMVEYRDPDLMVITDQNYIYCIFIHQNYCQNAMRAEWIRQNTNSGSVMIESKYCYTIIDYVHQTSTQNNTELVWAAITLK